MHRARILLAFTLIAAGAVAGAAVLLQGTADSTLPATERVLLPAPDPRGVAARGRFVDDPQGQIDRIAAGGHLVAWSVRSPADRRRTSFADSAGPSPLTLPAHSHVVVADEQTGTTATIAPGGRYVRTVWIYRDAAGRSNQLAVEHCTTRERCAATRYTVASDGAALKIGEPATDPVATAAVTGRVDRGRMLTVGRRPRRADGTHQCFPPVAVEDLASGTTTPLPAIPEHHGYFCVGLTDLDLRYPYVFATLHGRDATTLRRSRVDYDVVAVLRLDEPHPEWVNVQTVRSSSDYGTEFLAGPAYRADAAIWEDIDIDSDRAVNLQRIQLPGGLTAAGGQPRGDLAPAVLAGSANVCQIAATDAAVYELANPRCAIQPIDDRRAGSAIRRIVAPAWKPAENW